MSGHKHNPTAGTQNQGNSLGDRSCVRQSKLYRMYESGNDVKAILGTGHLSWDPNVKQGAYSGQKVYDHMQDSTYQATRAERNDQYGDAGRNPPAYNRHNNENEYPPRNSQGYYSKQENPKSYDAYGGNNDYGNNYQKPDYLSNNYGNSNPREHYGNRGTSSGGGASSFTISQSDYSAHNYSTAANEQNNFRRRQNQEPIANANDSYPLNKMGGLSDRSNGSNSYRSNPGVEDGYPLNKMGREERGNSGNYRSLKDQMQANSSASSFQSQRRKSSEYAAESVARSYFQPQQQERSTRPW